MILNGPVCDTPGQANTGFGGCVVRMGRIIGMILVPKNTEITYTDLTSFKTAITNGIYNNSPLLRYYPIQNLVPNADNTEDVSIQTYPDGTKVITAEGKYDFTFDILQGAFCLHYRLRKHNAIDEDVILIDEYNTLWGTEGTTSTTFRGYTPTIKYQNPVRPSTGTDAVTAYRFRLSFEPTQLNDRPAIVQFNNDSYPRTISGLQDVALAKVARAVNVLTVSAKTACGTVNLYDQYSAQLGVAGAWKATNAAGSDITISSVTLDATNKAFVITVSTADPDYTAGAPITVSLVGPNDLKALNVVGFESNLVVVTV